MFCLYLMLGSYLRKKFKRILVVVGNIFAKSKINPNLFTLFSIVLATMAAYFISQKLYFFALIWVMLAGLWDVFDGSLARAMNKVTLFGNYLDAMIDKYVEIIIFVGFALAGYAIEAFFVISFALVLSYAKPRIALVVKIDNHDWPAIGERIDRFVFLIVILTISCIVDVFGLKSTFSIGTFVLDITSVLLYFMAFILLIGSIQRMLYAKKIIESK